MIKRFIIIFILFITYYNILLAQVPTNQDCLGAIPVCQNVYSQFNSYSGTGNYPSEINNYIYGCPPSGTSCLGSGEKNDVWYVITIQQSGNLSFLITPNDYYDDYDWAVYNLTNANCSDIYYNSSLEVSCNYSADDGPTGANGGSAYSCQDAWGSAFNNVIPVQAGQTYVLNVSNFSSSQSGYTLNFSSSTAVIFDNVPPQIQSINQPIGCGSNTFVFNFSENILCSTISTADFKLHGPGGPYTITGITGVGCASGGKQEKTFTITVTPPITASGNYYLVLDATAAGSVTDLCGNTAPTDSLLFVISNITTNITNINPANCGMSDGSATVSVSGGTPPYTYVWSTVPVQTSSTATNLPSGVYYVTVSYQSCSVVDTATIPNVNGPSASITNITNANQGQNNGSATVTASGGTPPYTYVWNTNPQQTNATASGLAPGTYTVTVTDNNNCTTTATAVINEIPAAIVIDIMYSDAYCGQANGTATAIPSGGAGGGNFTFLWSNGASSSTITNLTAGTYTVTVSDGVLTSSESVTITSYPGPTASFIANPTVANLLNPSISFIDQSQGATSWEWDFGDGNVSCSQNAVHTYDGLGTYNVTLTVTDNNGCIGKTSLTVYIRDIYTLYIPNAFSPNNDGINDYFQPYGQNIDPDTYKLSIYNRWGQEVFYTEDMNARWDGRVNGSDNENKVEASYVYRLQAKSIDGSKIDCIGRIVLIP